MNRPRLSLTLLGLGVVVGIVAGVLHVAETTHAPVPRPNFLVIDIDTFSWDHMGVIRDGKSNTPNLDALAARGARFTQAISHSGWTLPALSSVLTGTMPVAIRVENGRVPFRAPGVRDLPQILSFYDYKSTVFWGGTLPGPVGGLVSAYFHQISTVKGPAIPATQEVLAWLGDTPAEPFFAYVHDVDLHQPFLYGDLPADDPYADPVLQLAGKTYAELHAALSAKIGEEAAQLATRAHYDIMVARYDAAVGRILAKLAKVGLADRTVIIVTSDHGEDLFEHAHADHGLLYDSTLKVPLIVVDPDMPRTGLVVDTVVQASDLAPTLLSRAGIPVDAGMDGRSWLPLIGLASGAYTERPVFSLTDACHASWRTKDRKVILRDGRPRSDRAWYAPGGDNGVKVVLSDLLDRPELKGLPMPDCSAPGSTGNIAVAGQIEALGPTAADLWVELYDLGRDPGERHNLVAEREDEAVQLLRPLVTTMVARKRLVEGTQGEALSPAQVRTIREQGYWGLVK